MISHNKDENLTKSSIEADRSMNESNPTEMELIEAVIEQEEDSDFDNQNKQKISD